MSLFLTVSMNNPATGGNSTNTTMMDANTDVTGIEYSNFGFRDRVICADIRQYENRLDELVSGFDPEWRAEPYLIGNYQKACKDCILAIASGHSKLKKLRMERIQWQCDVIAHTNTSSSSDLPPVAKKLRRDCTWKFPTRYEEVCVGDVMSRIPPDTVCAICCDVHPEEEDWVLTACNHWFGRACLQRWTDHLRKNCKKNPSCPVCKEVRPETTAFMILDHPVCVPVRPYRTKLSSSSSSSSSSYEYNSRSEPTTESDNTPTDESAAASSSSSSASDYNPIEIPLSSFDETITEPDNTTITDEFAACVSVSASASSSASELCIVPPPPSIAKYDRSMNANNFAFFESVKPNPVIDVLPIPVIDVLPNPVIDVLPIPVIDVVPNPVIDVVQEHNFGVVPLPVEVEVYDDDDDSADMISVFLEEDFITDEENNVTPLLPAIVLPKPQPPKFRSRCLVIVEDGTVNVADAGVRARL